MKYLTIFTILLLFCCSDDDSATQLSVTAENLIGRWQISEIADDNGTGSQEFRPATETETSIYIFSENLMFILESNNRTCPGDYSVNTSESLIGLNITCDDVGDISSTFRVDSLTESEIELSGLNADESAKFRMKKI